MLHITFWKSVALGVLTAIATLVSGHVKEATTMKDRLLTDQEKLCFESQQHDCTTLNQVSKDYLERDIHLRTEPPNK